MAIRRIGMKAQILRFLDVEYGEGSRVALLLVMSFFMGMFLATFSVASQTLFLKYFDEQRELPVALVVSGAFALAATALYNFFQNRIPFQLLAAISLTTIIILTAFIEFGESAFKDSESIYFFGFTVLAPFSFIIYLIFWGAFGRAFNLRQSKRLIGTVDMGAMIASFIAFFSITQYLQAENADTENLYTIALVSILAFTGSFLYLSIQWLNKRRTFAEEKIVYKKLVIGDFIQNRYILYMSLFVVVSMLAANFVDYSFLNVTTLYMDESRLASFISSFEMTIVIFGFLFQTIATDRIIREYGMRISLLVTPVLIGLFTVAALILGTIFGYSPEDNLFVVFFLIIAISKLLIRSLKDSLDNPTFKLYLLPIESHIRIDVQTKIEGLVTAFASLLAGALILLINRVEIFDLLYITLFTVPLLAFWFFVSNRMHASYRHTLQNALVRSKGSNARQNEKEYNLSTVLEKEVNSTTEDKVLYGLTLMEKLEPAVFESTITRLAERPPSAAVRKFAQEKIQLLGLTAEIEKSEIRTLAEKAYGELEDGDVLSIAPEKLLRLSKSVRQSDRLLAAKLLRKLIGPKTIFVLLELLRDADPRVRYEALYTARKVKRQETWPILIELLGSPWYSHHATAALQEAGEPVLPALEAAFHKSGQSDLVMLRIVQIMGRIGGRHALELLWSKADYPDKRIVKQILFSLRFINYQAKGRESRDVINLLETEMSKAIWNMAALHELPETDTFQYLREALEEEVAESYDQLYMLLSILYDPQSVQLVRDNIETNDPDNIAFAMELLDLFIDAGLKPKLLPLLDDSRTPVKLKALQLYFPRESYNPVQVINYILNRDFNLNNRWTKACAIHASAFLPEFRISRGLVAQMFNTDRLLQETAAWVIYHKDVQAYQAILERLPDRDKRFIDSSIENNRLLDGLNDGFFLWIEKVMFIKQIPAFHSIHGSLLADLADKIMPLDFDAGERIRLNSEDHNAPILIMAHGEIVLRNAGETVARLKKGDIRGELFSDTTVKASEAVAPGRAVAFRINAMDFYFVMANHHELVQGLIKNLKEEQPAPIE
jgi:AAA family ATP:ADP antiporter